MLESPCDMQIPGLTVTGGELCIVDDIKGDLVWITECEQYALSAHRSWRQTDRVSTMHNRPVLAVLREEQVTLFAPPTWCD